MNNNPNNRTAIACCLLLAGVFLALPAAAQWKIDSMAVFRDKKPLTTPNTAAFDDEVVLLVSGKDDRLPDLSKASVYINGKRMPAYRVTADCPGCVFFHLPADSSKTDSTRRDSTAGAATGAAARSHCYTVGFVLGRDSIDAWDKWYGFQNMNPSVTVDLGNEEKQLTCNSSYQLQVNEVPVERLVITLLVALLFIALSIVVAFKDSNDILRDSSTAKVKPFSLSRFQLYWWSVIIITCFILLFGLRDHFNLFNTTALTLLGISIATTGLASIIDYRDDDKERHQNDESEGFWKDILSDSTGVGIHRYQNVVFTFLFGIIFIYKVLQMAHMPDFDSTELILMGLSSTAYLALKTGENANAGNAAGKKDQQKDSSAGKAFPEAVG